MLGGSLGIVVCMLWFASSARIWAFYDLRIAQVRDSEPAGWNLTKGHTLAKFMRGGEVELAGGVYRMPIHARLPTRHVARLVIAAFLLLYGFIVFANGPWQPS